MRPHPTMRALLDVFFPPSCPACSALLPPEDAPAILCGDCQVEVEPTLASGCPRCGEVLGTGERECARCTLEAPAFSVAYAPFVHAGSVARAIHRFKYEDHPELARPLTSLLLARSETFLAQAPALVCAVPLHRRRFRERRFDQAMLLATEVARETGRTLVPDVLERIRDTPRQVGLTERERQQNVVGALRAKDRVDGQSFLLLDDVFTTGATAGEAARALVEAGALEVQVLTLARASTPL